MNAMESQIVQITDEIEEHKVANKALHDEISLAGKVEKQLEQQAEAVGREAAFDSIKFLSSPTKFIEAARYLDVNNLAWIYNQLGFMIQRSVPPQSVASPYQASSMYSAASYYGYPMMPMYAKNPYQPETED
eukprot:TRINITY_DN425_c0_g1_i4.p1 TRINITY_DN425_c0_g1~~TRINITY_DN425_c0_g1_i4.p1  ORF type:complete len:132 (-),score=36.84 TRINITY_DN425_c0_g1_i4:190-585(-)